MTDTGHKLTFVIFGLLALSNYQAERYARHHQSEADRAAQDFNNFFRGLDKAVEEERKKNN